METLKLSNTELARLRAPTGNTHPHTSRPAVQAHTKIKVEDDCEDDDHPEIKEEEASSGYSRDMSLETTDDDQDDDSNDRNEDYNNDNQPPASTNGTYSESLTRLQNGFLHAIAVLEDRNKALQYELNDVRSRQAQPNISLTRRVAYEERRNERLEAELRAARLWPHTHKKTLRDLELTLAKKNETIKEKNSKINEVEARNVKLEQEWKNERKKNKNLSATIEMQNKTHLEDKRSNGTSGGTISLPIRGRRSMVKAEESTVYPAMKKRKHEESMRGGSDNPVVLD